jgi:hypothetical protein
MANILILMRRKVDEQTKDGIDIEKSLHTQKDHQEGISEGDGGNRCCGGIGIPSAMARHRTLCRRPQEGQG